MKGVFEYGKKGEHINIFGDLTEEDSKVLEQMSKDIASGRVHSHEIFMTKESMDRHKKRYDERYGDEREYTFEELREKFKSQH